MPWKEVLPMNQKTQFVSDYLRDSLSFTELCQRSTGVNLSSTLRDKAGEQEQWDEVEQSMGGRQSNVCRIVPRAGTSRAWAVGRIAWASEVRSAA